MVKIWLSIANTYDSVPHRLIFFVLGRYGVQFHWISFIKAYCSGIYSESFSSSVPSSWLQHFRGIFGGCTLSIILFLAGTNVIIEYAILSKAPYFIYSWNVSPPLVRAFMDDMSLCHLLQQSLKIYSHTLYNTTNLGKHVLQGT